MVLGSNRDLVHFAPGYSTERPIMHTLINTIGSEQKLRNFVSVTSSLCTTPEKLTHAHELGSLTIDGFDHTAFVKSPKTLHFITWRSSWHAVGGYLCWKSSEAIFHSG